MLLNTGVSEVVAASGMELARGKTIPSVGFGTWQVAPGVDTERAVTTALAAGYRHIDTARAYGNEQSVGRAVARSGIPRDEIFVTSKLPAEVKTYDEALASFETTLALLGMASVDLYLIHAPWPWDAIGSDHREGNAQAWRALEDIQASGAARSIGVSNFTIADLDALALSWRTVPEVNQIRMHVGHTQNTLRAYCRANGIVIEAYSPLATGAVLDDPGLGELAREYSRSVAQLCIRYVLQKDAIALPKSTNPSRIAENLAIDFEISTGHMAELDSFGM